MLIGPTKTSGGRSSAFRLNVWKCWIYIETLCYLRRHPIPIVNKVDLPLTPQTFKFDWPSALPVAFPNPRLAGNSQRPNLPDSIYSTTASLNNVFRFLPVQWSASLIRSRFLQTGRCWPVELKRMGSGLSGKFGWWLCPRYSILTSLKRWMLLRVDGRAKNFCMSSWYLAFNSCKFGRSWRFWSL